MVIIHFNADSPRTIAAAHGSTFNASDRGSKLGWREAGDGPRGEIEALPATVVSRFRHRKWERLNIALVGIVNLRAPRQNELE
jgi:hypothetical protein